LSIANETFKTARRDIRLNGVQLCLRHIRLRTQKL
jgi:hypothetical protein